MANNEPVTLKLSKMTATVITSLLGIAIVALASNLWYLNRGLLEIQLWKTSLEAQDSALRNSLPRGEWMLEKQLINAEIEQLRARIVFMEQRQ